MILLKNCRWWTFQFENFTRDSIYTKKKYIFIKFSNSREKSPCESFNNKMLKNCRWWTPCELISIFRCKLREEIFSFFYNPKNRRIYFNMILIRVKSSCESFIKKNVEELQVVDTLAKISTEIERKTNCIPTVYLLFISLIKMIYLMTIFKSFAVDHYC